MSNIQSARGLNVPTFQPAGSKGDGAGNGSGGMYFGQDQQEDHQHSPFFSDFFPQFDLDDLPDNKPLIGFEPKPDILKFWKEALATELYAGIRGIPAEPLPQQY